jgi:superfamily II DNA or RNA helicase
MTVRRPRPASSPADDSVPARSLAAVRDDLARRMLPPLPPAQLGSVTLAPHQREAAARLRGIIARHRGALLADDVGLGKTYVALAVARDYAHCQVIAPAALGAMWTAAVARTQSRQARVHSLHAFSRGAPPVLTGDGRTLVVIDEAHHLRNANTARYRQVAQAIAGCDVLLLSATPLHNRTRELRTVLALFAGSRPDLLTEAQRAALIVRRHADQVSESAPRPTVQRHGALRLSMDSDTLTRILSLPAPLPARDGAVAGALIRMGLLRAWCSSDAALSQALRRRRLRGATLRDALRTGLHPTNAELRAWVATEREAQLGFPELLATGEVESGPLLAVLEQHLAALEALSAHLRDRADTDAMRARVLRRLAERHPGTPVVAFTQYTRTVHALYRALGDIAGVAALTGSGARIASGPIPRWEALQLFAPRSQGRPPPPPHLAIHLLITTDILAEGVNLQDAGVVVHLDLPWTAALRDQRVGRCVRIGSSHAAVHVYRVAPSRAVEQRVRLEARVLRKAALARRVITGDARHAPADRVPELQAMLERWRDDRPRSGSSDDTDLPLVAAQRADVRAALTVVDHGGTATLLAVVARGTRWVATTRLDRVVALVRRIDVNAPAMPTVDADVRAVGRAVARWRRRTASRALAGQAPSELSAIQRQLLARLTSATAALSTADRRRLTPTLHAARDAILSAIGPSAERQLMRWHDTAHLAPAAWLTASPATPSHQSPAPSAGNPKPPRHRDAPAPILLLRPDEPSDEPSDEPLR